MEGNKLWVFNIEGSAFLWHQVRCMVAVVFMVGQGLEDPDVRARSLEFYFFPPYLNPA